MVKTNTSKELFIELFQHYLDAIQYQINENFKKLNFDKYHEYHLNCVSELNKAQKLINEEQKNNEMKKISDTYFKYIKHVIFDIPRVFIRNEDEDLPFNQQVNQPFNQQVNQPFNQPFNPQVNPSSGSTSYINNSDETSPELNIISTIFNFMTISNVDTKSDNGFKQIPFDEKVGGFTGCTSCMLGGKGLQSNFTNPKIKKYHNYLVAFYDIILHQYYKDSANAWDIVERYTEKLNAFETEYINGTGYFVDFTTERKDVKLHSVLRKVVFDGYKEFNSIASRIN